MSGTARAPRWEPDPGEATMMPVSDLREADSPRRSGLDGQHVRLLAEQAEWPPITVHRSTMRVIDGMHRLSAARLRGQAQIAVWFFDGDDAEAFALGVRLNTGHGLPLSLPDRKAAAARIIASHQQWSDRLVASLTGLAARTVANVRLHGAPGDDAPPAGTAQPSEVRIGRDGRVRRLNGAEGRQIAAELMRERPGLSLRQVGRAAGISPETARAVRKQLGQQAPVSPPTPGVQRGRRAGGGSAGRPLATRTRSAAPPDVDFGGALRRLKADPSLRLTQTGRILLRMLYAHAVSDDELARIIDVLPAGCRVAVGHAALECAAAWQWLADRIDGPQYHSDQEPENGGSS